jgi:hypothetical protein
MVTMNAVRLGPVASVLCALGHGAAASLTRFQSPKAPGNAPILCCSEV